MTSAATSVLVRLQLTSFLLRLGLWLLLLNDLLLLSSFTGIHLDVQHIAGPKNEDADYLSRWLEHAPLAARWKLSFRRRISLKQLWHASPQISFSPPSWKPSFQVPSGSPLGAAL